MQWPLAVTLTGPNVSEITGSIKRMRKALFRFRKNKFFGGNVAGGVTSFEVTNEGRGWHVHCHLLVDCRWLALNTRPPRTSDTRTTVRELCACAHRELSAQWGRCLGLPEAVTWAERAYGKALIETLKYNVKPAQLIECQDEIAPLIDEMHRMQLVSGFGTCYRLGAKWKKEDLDNRPPTVCDQCEAKDSWIAADSIRFHSPKGQIGDGRKHVSIHPRAAKMAHRN
jgi:hypothetical protein